ncbi:MAG: hypothetical protein QM820_22885 [Minicystis sp.]
MRAASFSSGRVGPFGTVAIPLWDMGRAVREGISTEGTEAWLRSLVSAYLRRYYARPDRGAAHAGLTEEDAARTIVRRACVRSALMGGATGTVTTVTSIATAQSNGMLGVVTVPAAAAAVGIEVLARAAVHLEMICQLAELFELRFDPEDPTNLWALLALSFGADEDNRSNPPRAGDELVHLARVQAEEIARRMGRFLIGESLVRNAVPVVSIASSSVLSYVVTRRLGDNARRYARYRRAFDDVLADAKGLDAYLDLLIEGVWFLFTADGRLSPEESALLASLVRRASPAMYARIADELADDIGWVKRLPRLPEHLRDPFLRALEVAAAVDKKATLRERRLLEHAAGALGRSEDFVGLSRMMRDFREVGVLSDAP